MKSIVNLNQKRLQTEWLFWTTPFFFDCFQEHLPLNSILAVHLKTGDIVKAIIHSFTNGDANNSSNVTHLKTTAWNSIIDNMIDILYQNVAREYKTLPRKLVDLLTTNDGISVNLNTDRLGRLLRCFCWYVNSSTRRDIDTAHLHRGLFLIGLRRSMALFLISVPRLLTVIPSFYVSLFYQSKKQDT